MPKFMKFRPLYIRSFLGLLIQITQHSYSIVSCCVVCVRVSESLRICWPSPVIHGGNDSNSSSWILNIKFYSGYVTQSATVNDCGGTLGSLTLMMVMMLWMRRAVGWRRQLNSQWQQQQWEKQYSACVFDGFIHMLTAAPLLVENYKQDKS